MSVENEAGNGEKQAAAESPQAEQTATGAETEGQATEAQAPKEEGKQGEAAATGADSGEAEDEPEGAPETYEFENADNADPAILDAYKGVAKELNLTQKQAQQMLDTVTKAADERAQAQRDEAISEWQESARKDKEYGGKNFDESLGTAKTAYEQFASDELKTLLDNSGLGNHPEVIRLFYRVGKAIGEDAFVDGVAKKPQGADQSVAQRMYPDMNP